MTLCDACALIFHTSDERAVDGCECRHFDCGCRRKRERREKK